MSVVDVLILGYIAYGPDRTPGGTAVPGFWPAMSGHAGYLAPLR